jgi:hypothetical protein
MPRYVSGEGTLIPAKEKVGLVNQSDKTIEVNGKQVLPGEPFIYEGADRAALYELWKAGETTFGINFRKSPDFLKMIRDLNFNNIDDYLDFVGYDQKKAKEEFEKNASNVTKHDIVKSVEMIKVIGGGKDFSGGGNDKYGGFGKPAELGGQND